MYHNILSQSPYFGYLGYLMFFATGKKQFCSEYISIDFVFHMCKYSINLWYFCSINSSKGHALTGMCFGVQ